MGWYFGLFVGFISGLALVAGWNFFMANRSSFRNSKAAWLSLLGQMQQDDVKKLCQSNYPPWIAFTSFERVKWLNKLLEKIWPSVAMAASEIIRTSVEPRLRLYAPPGFKLNFAKLFLGNVAPQIEGVKIQKLKAGQLIMDLDFKWGGDPSIILSVHTPVGAQLPVQLKSLRFFATVRVIFKLAEDVPCISGVVVALLEKPKPEIRYTLKLIGGNLNAVPGLSDLIEGIVENAVADSLQWPHRILVPVSPTPVDLSDLELRLQGKLTVKVMKAQNLKNAEMIGKSDPYVVGYVRVLFQSKTKVVENNLNPVWEETMEFNVEDQETQSLVLQVFDKDVGTDKCLGCATYPVVKLNAEETTELVLPLTKKLDMSNVVDKHDRGNITIQVTYHSYSMEEQKAAMDAEKADIEAKKEATDGGIIGGTMDAIGGAVGGAGKLVAGGAGAVGTGFGKAGKFVTKGTSSFVASKRRPENGVPGTPK